MAEGSTYESFNEKDSPREWGASYSPDFIHDVAVEKPERNVSEQPTETDDADLTMEFMTEQEKRHRIRNISINEYVKVEDHISYKISIHIQERSWQVLRRYRAFHRLHEDLVQRHGIGWELLPPKKIVGNLNTSHLEKRRVLLEKYLKNVISILPEFPRSLISFLEMDQFDVNSVCQQLARDMYEIGDDLLAKGLVFKLTPLQIHCINRRLQLALPTCESQDPREDIGHLYSFLQQIPMILIYPGIQREFVTNEELTYNLSIFRSLKYLEIQQCDLELLESLDFVQKQVTEIRVHKSLQLLKDFLIGSQSWAQGILMTVDSGKEKVNEITSRFQTWDSCVKASFSYNDIQSIDYSITLLPKVSSLDLSHNLLTEVDYLEELTFLTDLNLSYNELRYLGEFPYKIPSVSSLNLAGNGIQDIKGLERMYSLERLNISNNRIKRVKNVLPLGNLPLLKKLRVIGNPFSEVGNFRVLLFAQFGHRASEVSLDGLLPTKREMSKIKDIIASQESYDIIVDTNYVPVPPPSSNVTAAQHHPQPSTSLSDSSDTSGLEKRKSPRQRKIDRVAEIRNVSKDQQDEKTLIAMENEDEDFRSKIEKLREHGGDSWLTFYNEMQEDNSEENSEAGTKTEKKTHSLRRKEKTDSLKRQAQKQKQTSTSEQKKEVIDEIDQEIERNIVKKKEQINPNFVRLLSIEEIDLELSDELRAEIKRMIRENVDVFNETFLVSIHGVEDALDEYMIAVDNDAKVLMQIKFDTGSTVHNYHLDSVRGFSVEAKADQEVVLQFEAKIDKPDTSYSLVRFFTKSVKDAAGLYIVLKSCNDGKRGRGRSKTFTTTEVTVGLIDNPLNIDNEILMTFFQDFIQKSSSFNKRTNIGKQGDTQHAQTNYENVDIGLSFLKHVDGNGRSVPQDILSVLWVGCLPYLFPDEEIPVCVVMTTLNIFLFRVFYAEQTLESSNAPTTPAFEKLSQIQEVMHCFYSFPLTSLQEVVVGLFDQGLRIEVAGEGPRGSFVFLTRDATKTSQFLDTLSSIVSIRNDKTSMVAGSSSEENKYSDASVNTEETNDTADQNEVRVIYPDEKKIQALKVQLQEQKIAPFDDRENLISYCIVYQHWNNDVIADTTAGILDGFEEPAQPYLRSLILTNIRIILCDEDYVHWPLPSFVHSTPFTPQWIVDDIYNVEDVIGVDLWEDLSNAKSMTGCYGVSITFDNVAEEVNESSADPDFGWNIFFQSHSEREQFVRSLASIWKNNFEQELKITKSTLHTKKKGPTVSTNKMIKVHAKTASGNVTIPSRQCIESPEMFMSVDRSRLNELFRNKIASGEDQTITGVQYIACVGCKPYKYPEREFPVALLMGKYNLYLICSSKNRKYLLANTPLEDQGSTVSLYISVIAILELRQVAVGLFDQCLRLETDTPAHTHVFVTRDFDRTNDFIQRLSQAILSLPKQPQTPQQHVQPEEIFKIYKPAAEDIESSAYYPKSEFIHPNSNIKFVYPSDELMEKLRVKILNYLRVMDLFEKVDEDENFSVLLYALIFKLKEVSGLDVSNQTNLNDSFDTGNEDKINDALDYDLTITSRHDGPVNILDVSKTIVITENFICLIDEDHVNYPLPLFVKELPDRPQYEVTDVQLISGLLRVEFEDFHSGAFSLVFNTHAVDPSYYDARFHTSNVEDDTCLVTDVNSQTEFASENDKEKDNISDDFYRWSLKAHSYTEREKIVNILSKMWTNIFNGITLPIIRRKKI